MKYEIINQQLFLSITPKRANEFKSMDRRRDGHWLDSNEAQRHIFDDLTGFSWAWVDPLITNDMTSSPILAALGNIEEGNINPDDMGSLRGSGLVFAGWCHSKPYYHPILARWHFEDYAVTTPQRILVENRNCVMRGGSFLEREGQGLVNRRNFVPKAEKRLIRLQRGSSGVWFAMSRDEGFMNQLSDEVLDEKGYSYFTLGTSSLAHKDAIAAFYRTISGTGATFSYDHDNFVNDSELYFQVSKIPSAQFPFTRIVMEGGDCWPDLSRWESNVRDRMTVGTDLRRARMAFTGQDHPVLFITTAVEDPSLLSNTGRKGGSVYIKKGMAFGHFQSTWAGTIQLAQKFGVELDSDELDDFDNHVPNSPLTTTGKGCGINFQIIGKRFEALMEDIRARELQVHQLAFKYLTDFREYVKQFLKDKERKNQRDIRRGPISIHYNRVIDLG